MYNANDYICVYIHIQSLALYIYIYVCIMLMIVYVYIHRDHIHISIDPADKPEHGPVPSWGESDGYSDRVILHTSMYMIVCVFV